MTDAGRLLLIAGLVLALVGAVVWGLGRAGFRGLPGDFRYESQHVRFYFPIVTCLVISLLLTAALWLWHWLTRR